jgi:hypothetical protein
MGFDYDEKNLNYWGVPVEDEAYPTEQEKGRQHVTVLLIGRSGSGKTALAKSILEAYGWDYDDDDDVVYALNDRSDTCPYQKITWPQLDQISDCALVVEDLIKCSKAQVKQLQELLNFNARHKNIGPVILVAHTLTGNNIYTLLPSFHFVYIAAIRASRVALTQLMITLGFEPEERKTYQQVLKNCSEKFCHLKIDMDTHEVIVTKAGQKAELAKENEDKKVKAARKPNLATTASKYLSDLPEGKKALLLFDMVHPKIPKGKLDPAYLTVQLKNERGEEVILSLIDYLAALTAADGDAEPALLKFHSYLKSKGVKLPRAYVANKKFW